MNTTQLTTMTNPFAFRYRPQQLLTSILLLILALSPLSTASRTLASLPTSTPSPNLAFTSTSTYGSQSQVHAFISYGAGVTAIPARGLAKRTVTCTNELATWVDSTCYAADGFHTLPGAIIGGASSSESNALLTLTTSFK